jgi:hypothetical protein
MDRQKRGPCRSCRNSPARRVRPPSLAGQLRVSNVRRRVRSSSGCSTGKARSSNKPSLDQVGSSADREEGRILGRDHSQQRSRIRRIFGSSSRSGGKARSSIHVGLGRGGGSVVFEPVRVRSKATSSTHLGPGRSGAPVSEPASVCSPDDSPQTLRARVVPRHGGFGDRRRRPGDGLAQPSLTGESAFPGDFCGAQGRRPGRCCCRSRSRSRSHRGRERPSRRHRRDRPEPLGGCTSVSFVRAS